MKLVFDVTQVSDVVVEGQEAKHVHRTVCLKVTHAIRAGHEVVCNGSIVLGDDFGHLDNFRIGTTVELGQ